MRFKSKYIISNSTDLAPAKAQIFSALEVRESEINGRGVYAREFIPKGTIISVDGGDLVTAIDDLPADKVFAVIYNKNVGLIPHDYNNPDPLCFLNHSCDSNVARVGSLIYVAKKDIQKEEELTADYATLVTDVEGWTLSCSCGSSKCRKTITSVDYKKPQLQIELWNEWPPYVQQYILKKR
jgi:uncharacterized protein